MTQFCYNSTIYFNSHPSFQHYVCTVFMQFYLCYSCGLDTIFISLYVTLHIMKILALCWQDVSSVKQKSLFDFTGLSVNLFWTFYSKLRKL